jgi:hypothetical protein
MLKQDFNLSMPELDGELPQDASGIDVAGVWKTVRRHIKSIKGWEVTEQVTLATLSFTKYLMWKDLVDRTDMLKRNPVVRHLIDTPTHNYNGSGAGFIDARTIDEIVEPVDLFAPLSADSSQIAAVVAAERGADYVLFGPPGTGKSQTIANAITNCLAHRKTVLFVSQKTAALEVVRQRMESIGLGNYCLEVHSTKAQKSNVLEQLATAWRERNLATEEHWSAAADDLKSKRDQLNRLVSALHRRRANGMTAYEVFGRVVAGRDRLIDIELTWPDGTLHSPAQVAKMRETCAEMRVALEAVGDPSVHPLRGIEQSRWTPAWAQSLQATVDSLQGSLLQMKEAANALATSLGLDEVVDDSLLPQLIKLSGLLLNPEAADGVLLLAEDATQRVRVLNALAAGIARIRQKASELSTRYDLKAIQLDLATLQRDWTDACASNVLMRTSRKKKVRLHLQPYCADGVPDDIGRDLIVLLDLADLIRMLESLRPHFRGIERLWRGLESDPPHILSLIKWVQDLQSAIDAFQINGVPRERIAAHLADLLTQDMSRFRAGGEVSKAYHALHKAFPAMRQAAKDVGACIGLTRPEELVQLSAGWIDDLHEQTARWKANIAKAPRWATWRHAAKTA